MKDLEMAFGRSNDAYAALYATEEFVAFCDSR